MLLKVFQSFICPSLEPTSTPSKPSNSPSRVPTDEPSAFPSLCPSLAPTVFPSAPSSFPSRLPTYEPSEFPSSYPSQIPTLSPSVEPSFLPSNQPSKVLQRSFATESPTVLAILPTEIPSLEPSYINSESAIPIVPLATPTLEASVVSSVIPSTGTTIGPSLVASDYPSSPPRLVVSSALPTEVPTIIPSSASSQTPIVESSTMPTVYPSSSLQSQPAATTSAPSSQMPSTGQTVHPTVTPTCLPTLILIMDPSRVPTGYPSVPLTMTPTSGSPSCSPSLTLTLSPHELPTPLVSTVSTTSPTILTSSPTTDSITDPPSNALSDIPLHRPTWLPSYSPTVSPTEQPSHTPSVEPSQSPSIQPTILAPSHSPTALPSEMPSQKPTTSTVSPTVSPSEQPSHTPSVEPSQSPSVQPTILAPSHSPTALPSEMPSQKPTTSTVSPTVSATEQPSHTPSVEPSQSPSVQPTILAPSHSPTKPTTVIVSPTVSPTEQPSHSLIVEPSQSPSVQPTILAPSHSPTFSPTSHSLTDYPTMLPSEMPSQKPTTVTVSPTVSPTEQPSHSLTVEPSQSPCSTLSIQPTILAPSQSPISLLTSSPSSHSLTDTPIERPSYTPSEAPFQILPTVSPFLLTSSSNPVFPSIHPSGDMSRFPTEVPSQIVSTCSPISTSSIPPWNPPSQSSTVFPTTNKVTISPTMSPSSPPSASTFPPSFVPSSNKPIATTCPSVKPTATTTYSSSSVPSLSNSLTPSHLLHQISFPPSLRPSQTTEPLSPSLNPTDNPIIGTSSEPSIHSAPSLIPSTGPSISPVSPTPTLYPSFSTKPSVSPVVLPSLTSTAVPSLRPTNLPTAIHSLASPNVAQIPKPVVADSVQLSSPLPVSNFNTQLNLLLVASIRSATGCYSNWTSSEPTLQLSKAAIISGSQYVLPKKTTTVQLYLFTNVLSVQHTYQFTVHCGHLQSMITVTTNSPPSSGLFEVSPDTGAEVSTVFTFSARLWVDSNLPLSYQFGYSDPTSGALSVLKDRSISNSTKSNLPAGISSLKYLINSTMVVYDALSASVSRKVTVQVKPTNSSNLHNYITSQLSGVMSSAAIVLVGNLINAVNCTGTSRCVQYNRLPCSTVDYTCGECLNGYVGVAGPQNSLCIKLASKVSKSTFVGKCAVDSDCDSFQICNSTSNSCYLPSKQCPNQCSSQGLCKFMGTDSGMPMSDCKVTASTCQAVCFCNTGFAGTSCSYTAAQLAEKISQRSQLLQSFNNLPSQNVSSATVIARATTLLSLTKKTDELSGSAVKAALVAAGSLLQNAVEAKVNYADLTPVLASANSVASAVQSNNQSAQLLETVRLYGTITSAQMVGQQKVDNIYSNFRLSTVGLSKSGTNLSVPLSAFERLQSPISSSVYIQQNSSNTIDLKVTVIESSARLLGGDNDNPYLSNPLMVHVSDLNGLSVSNETSIGHDIRITLKNVSPLTIIGRAGLEDSGVLQLVAMSELVTSDFVDTFSAAPSLTNPLNIEKALIVIVMFATLWSVGISLVFICNYRRQLKKKDNEQEEKLLDRKRRGAEVAQSPVAIQDYLSSYISQVFPAVFQQQSRFLQVIEEIRKHHRYLAFFITDDSGSSADKARLMNAIHYQDPVLTVKMIIVIAILVSICTAVFLRPIEFLFEILNAPIADEKKLQLARANLEGKILNATRRASLVITDTARKAANTLSAVKQMPKKKVAGVETRMFPMSTTTAQELARASASIIAPAANQNLQQQRFQCAAFKRKLLDERVSVNMDDHDNDLIQSYRNPQEPRLLSSEHSKQSSSNYSSIEDLNIPVETPVVFQKDNRFLSEATDTLLEELTEDISIQRRFLTVGDLEEFDLQWGIDPTGEFVREERVAYCILVEEGAKKTISTEIDLASFVRCCIWTARWSAQSPSPQPCLFGSLYSFKRRIDQLVVHPLHHCPGLEEKSEEILVINDSSSSEQDDDADDAQVVSVGRRLTTGKDVNYFDSADDDDEAVSSFHTDGDGDYANSIRVPSNIS
eukprot:gene27095-35809_t